MCPFIIYMILQTDLIVNSFFYFNKNFFYFYMFPARSSFAAAIARIRPVELEFRRNTSKSIDTSKYQILGMANPGNTSFLQW